LLVLVILVSGFAYIFGNIRDLLILSHIGRFFDPFRACVVYDRNPRRFL
jgi:hypothetical protein